MIKDKAILDVKLFGAKGDGATDDSRAIQNALNTGNSVQLSNGIFILKEPIRTTKENQLITGNGLIKIVRPELTWSLIRLNNSGCILDGLGIENSFSQGAVHISANNCTIQNCKFIETRYRGYHIFIGNGSVKTTIQNNQFIGGNTNEPMIFVSDAKELKIHNNYFKDSGSWAIHTDYVDDVVISDNRCENAHFDETILASEGQNMFKFDTSNMFTFPSFGIMVFSGEKVLKDGFTKKTQQGFITITFAKSRKKGEKIRCLAFKSAENFNINSRTHQCIIQNNYLNNSGDSNITIASDYRGKVLDPINTKKEDHPTDITIRNNHLENAFGCNIAVSQTNEVNIINNRCINAGFGQFSTFYSAGISIPQSIRSTINENSIINQHGGNAKIGILALENSIETKKILRNNTFSNVPTHYYLGAESDFKDFKSGVFIEGQYKPYGNLTADIGKRWKNNYLPYDSEFFSFDQHMNVSAKDQRNRIMINNATDGYFGINLKKYSMLRNTLTCFRFNAHTRSIDGEGLIQILYKWGNNYQTKNIPLKGSELREYEVFIPLSNPQDVRFRLVAKKKNDIFFIDSIKILFLKL